MLNISYKPYELQKKKGIELTLPISKEIYSTCFELIIKALGKDLAVLQNELAHKHEGYKSKFVFYDRFRFDVCWMPAPLIIRRELDAPLFEMILRQIYQSITFSDRDGIVKFKRLSDVV